jgi:hypothetical protein
MRTRRGFLAATAGSVGVAGLAGCLGGAEDEEKEEFPEDDPPELDDDFLTSLADPSEQVPPRYFAAYRYDLGDVAERLDPLDVLPNIQGRISAGSIAETIETSMDGIALADVDYVTGSTYRASPILGGVGVPVPGGEGIHLTGEFSADPFVGFFESSDGFESLGEDAGYERFVNERDSIDRFTAFGVDDGRLIAVERSDAEADPAPALAIEFDQVGRSDAPIALTAREFFNAVQELDQGSIRAGASYAFVPMDADTGTAAFDEVVRGVSGSGLRVNFDQETELDRTVTYLDEDMASETAVSDAFQAAESSDPPHSGWSFSRSDATITARTTVADTPDQDLLRTGLPVPGYGSVFQLANPSDLGRSSPPQIFFQPAIDSGRLAVTHAGGTEVETLRVRYVHDGEVLTETWEGPVQQGDQFTSEQSIDSGTRAWIVWQADSVDAAVVGRFET